MARKHRNTIADHLCRHNGHKLESVTRRFVVDPNNQTEKLIPDTAVICTACGLTEDEVRAYRPSYHRNRKEKHASSNAIAV